LQLQREQIKIQAEETRRLADYNDALAKSARAQEIVTFKNYALGEVRDLFESYDEKLGWLYHSLLDFKEPKNGPERDMYGQLPYYFQITGIDLDGYRIEQIGRSDLRTMNEFEVSYSEVEEIVLGVLATKPLIELVTEARDLGVEDWILNRLPFRTEHKSLRSESIRLILTAARAVGMGRT
jgi:hypothetical protein